MTLPASGNPISFSQVDVELGYSATAQISMNDTAVRTLFGVASGAIGMSSGLGKSNTSVPGAPTSVSASATSCSAISVSFSAPACTGHLTIDSYQVVCTSSGSNSATGSSSPISITGLSAATSYTFKVRAHNSIGYGSYSSSTGAATTSGSQSYTTAGTYSWVAPAGVTSVSVVTVGGGGNGGNWWFYTDCYGSSSYEPGGGGSGGGLAYTNNYSVTPGNSYCLRVSGPSGSSSYFINSGALNATSGQASSLGGPQAGGVGSGSLKQGSSCSHGGAAGCAAGTGGGGGGAAGYSGPGGDGGRSPSNLGNTSGRGGGGGGGGSGGSFPIAGAGAGGVGLFGQGSDGSAGGSIRVGGGGGSGGGTGVNSTYPPHTCGAYLNGGAGGAYGGGGGGAANCGASSGGSPGAGGGGAVRIVWPGNTRTFPSTSVGSP